MVAASDYKTFAHTYSHATSTQKEIPLEVWIVTSQNICKSKDDALSSGAALRGLAIIKTGLEKLGKQNIMLLTHNAPVEYSVVEGAVKTGGNFC